jgi:hypothetical protein
MSRKPILHPVYVEHVYSHLLKGSAQIIIRQAFLNSNTITMEVGLS